MEKIVIIGILLRGLASLVILCCAYAAGATGEQLPLLVMVCLLAAVIYSEVQPGKPFESALFLFPAVCSILATAAAGLSPTPLAFALTALVYLISFLWWVALDLHHYDRVMMALSE
jgi:hypothetical protein